MPGNCHLPIYLQRLYSLGSRREAEQAQHSRWSHGWRKHESYQILRRRNALRITFVVPAKSGIQSASPRVKPVEGYASISSPAGGTVSGRGAPHSWGAPRPLMVAWLPKPSAGALGIFMVYFFFAASRRLILANPAIACIGRGVFSGGEAWVGAAKHVVVAGPALELVAAGTAM